MPGARRRAQRDAWQATENRLVAREQTRKFVQDARRDNALPLTDWSEYAAKVVAKVTDGYLAGPSGMAALTGLWQQAPYPQIALQTRTYMAMSGWPMQFDVEPDVHVPAERVPGNLIGFRQWDIRDGLLTPLNFPNLPWKPGVNVAMCARGGLIRRDHGAAPDQACKCGLHAFYEHRPRHTVYVCGAVVMGGRVGLQATTFRGQTARIVALVDESAAYTSEEIRAVADRYGVPVVPRAELSTVALEHGRLVTVDERPEPDPYAFGFNPSFVADASKVAEAMRRISEAFGAFAEQVRPTVEALGKIGAALQEAEAKNPGSTSLGSGYRVPDGN